MVDGDPLETQRDVAPAVESELGAAGFVDAHEIGHGGFGTVYRCLQPSLDRTIAVKVLTRDLDEENRSRFFREQRAMGRLTGHPNIVNVLQVGTTPSGHPFIVMPYHPLDSLDSLIRRAGPLPLEQVLRLGIKMAGAIETAHRLGILHRDVKPGNILLSRYGEPALTDFGIAHIAGGFETATGTITGSPAFTAPEVLRGDPPTPASDIYSLGATLFSALTGHAAFERRCGEQMVAQFVRITNQPIPDLREHGIPDDTAQAIEHAMSRNPDDRPGSAAEFGDALRESQLRNGLAVDEMALIVEDGTTSAARDVVASTAAARARQSAAPLRSSVGNLPLEVTSFVGRRDELSTAKSLFDTGRLVTLTGIGGVGKTRLALRLAADTRKNFPQGVWLAELGELLDESLLIDLVARALGLRIQGTDPMNEVVEFLAARRLLIVLDNCEQVIDEVANFAETLLRTCPDSVILATSREPLNVAGEAVLRVPPLTMPDPDHEPALMGTGSYDAVALFEERAATAVPGFALTDDNLGTVVRICSQLDGLPLAIELAAARLRAMSLDQILQRLTNRYKFLTHGNRAVPTRQQTLRLCIDWSYELCTPLERQIWAQLSVFAGSFELDAAEGICAEQVSPDELLDVVVSLVDKSILIRDEQDDIVRFRMLETLRDFGREKAQAGSDYLKLRRRHHDWFRQLVLDAEADWISDRQLEWLARLGREQPNLREAMEFALGGPDGLDPDSALQMAGALFPFWLSRNLLIEGRYWLGRALAKLPAQATAERIKAIYAGSILAEVLGDLASAASLIAAGQELAAEMADPVSDARIATAEGLFALYSGDLPRACADLEKAVQAFSAQSEIAMRVWILMMLGLCYELDGRTAQSIACHEEVLAITESRGESVYRSYSLWGMGVVLFRQGGTRRAKLSMAECLRLCRQVDEPFVVAACLEVLAWIAGHDEDADRAAVLLGAAESLGSAVGTSPVVIPLLRVHHDECERLTRNLLGEKAFRARYRKGARFGLEEAIAYGLSEGHPEKPSAGARNGLTKREWQVADLVAHGLSNQAIATKLVISQRTAQRHVDHIFAKLGLSSRKQVVAWVREHAQSR